LEVISLRQLCSVKKLRLISFGLSFSTFSVCTNFASQVEGLTFSLFENLDALQIASGVYEMKVRPVVRWMWNESDGHMSKATRTRNSLCVLEDKSVFTTFTLEIFTLFTEARIAEQSFKSVVNLGTLILGEATDELGHEVNQNLAWIQAEKRSDNIHRKPSPAGGINEDEWKGARSGPLCYSHEFRDCGFKILIKSDDLSV